jgi:isopentenyl diphosphate isomerase/L-lactate dehydrogenase-like FMN-dependent dehydrogenase
VEPQLTLTDVEQLAKANVDHDWFEYFVGGAGAERTMADNVAAYGRWRLRQRVLCGIGQVSTETTVLGHRVSSPVVVAPVAYQRMAHPEGELAMARGAARAGCALCLSTFATVSPAEVAAAAPDVVKFLQVYVFRDHGVTDELIAQALDAGFEAVFLTVDLPVLGARDRERRVHWTFPEESLPAVGYAIDRGMTGEGLELLDAALDWSYVERLVSSLSVPVVVKGVLEPEDAVLAAEHGAAGVVVSNHGGRQLDGVAATLDALPAVVAAVGDRLEVMVDGGIRRGGDVALALALGADAVLAGRTPLWGLAAGGEDGAAAVLDLLREELAVGLHLTGCRTPADLGEASVSAPRP